MSVTQHPTRVLLILLVVAWPCMAAALPTDGWLVWESNRKDQRQEVYVKKVDQPGENRLTFSGGRLPLWSNDGKWISFFDMSNGWATIMRPDGSNKTKVCDSKVFDWVADGQFWMHDGSGLVCVESDVYYLYDPVTAKRTLLLKKDDFPPLVGKVFGVRDISRLGDWVAGTTDLFRNGYNAKNGTFKAFWSAAFIDIVSKDVYFLGQGCEPTFSPTTDTIFHVCSLDCPNPTDIVQMQLADKMTRSSYKAVVSYPDASWGHDYYPRLSHDGKWLAYSGALTHAGNYDVFIHQMGAGNTQREPVTNSPTTNDTFPHLFIGMPHGFDCWGAAQCDDGKTCTKDTCAGDYTCSHTAISGCCTKASECDDSNPCTSDLCQANACSHPKISGCCTKAAECDDGNGCTTDACTGNVCVFTPVAGCCKNDSDCTDSNPCNQWTCDTSSGTCVVQTIKDCCAVDTDCDDQKACTNDTCDTTHVCQFTASPGCCDSDGECDDHDPCTSDHCTANVCVNTPLASCCQADGGCGDGATPDAGSDGGTTTVTRVLEGGCSTAPGHDPGGLWVLLGLGLLLWRRD